MTDFACETPANVGINEQAEKVRQHQPGPNHSDPEMEDRAMAVEPYNARNAGCQQEQTTNYHRPSEKGDE